MRNKILQKLNVIVFFIIFCSYGKNITEVEKSNIAIDSILQQSITISTSFGEMKIFKFCNGKIANLSIYCLIKNLNDEIYEEAEKLKIDSDKVYVTFNVNENYQIIEYEIIKKGNLKSYNNFIVKYCEEIITETKKQNIKVFEKCLNNKSQKYSVPIIITLN